MKKLFSILLIISILLCVLPVLAEDEEPWYYSYDRGLARQGMTLAAMTAGKAVDLLEGGAEDPDGLLAEFSNIDYLSPEKFIFVFLNSDQAATVRKALNVQEDIQIAPALAEYVNRKADNSYAEAASRVVSDPMDGLEMTTGTTILVLSYGAHIAVACEGRMALIIGTKEISAALNTEGVQAFAAELGSEDVSMRIYEGEDISRLNIGASWSGTGYNLKLENCVCASQARFEALFPQMIENPYFDAYAVRTVLYGYLRKAQSTSWLIETCRRFIPQMLEAYQQESALEMMRSNCDDMRPFDYEAAAPAEYEFGEPGEEVTFAPGDTFLFVTRRQYPNRENTDVYDDPVATLDMISEALLPADAISESADYIILCDVVWGPQHTSWNGRTIFYPNVHVAVYENGSGRMVRDLGSFMRKLSGMVVVQETINYYAPLRSQVFEALQPLLEEIQAH